VEGANLIALLCGMRSAMAKKQDLHVYS